MLSSQSAVPEGSSGPFLGARGTFTTAILLEKFLPLAQVQNLHTRARAFPSGNLPDSVLAHLQVKMAVLERDVARIAVTGGVLVVCNRPFGMLESTVVGALAQRVRSDVKILANEILREVDLDEGQSIYYDAAFGTKRAASQNISALRQCIRWLQGGGVLITFPSVEPALQFARGAIAETWDEAVARLLRITGATALPIYLRGHARPALQALNFVSPSVVHPTLRQTLLLSDFLAQKGRTVHLRVGRPIPAAAITTFDSNVKVTNYLRWRTHLLGQHFRKERRVPTSLLPMLPKPRMERMTQPVSHDRTLSDIENLRADQILDDSREFTVFAAREHEIPNILPELGRLREMTFREVGEGTGRSIDLDTFDRYYTHIVLWNKIHQEPVGAYRIGNTANILPLRGIDGLYTSTLFRFDHRFFDQLGPALELGRSFVRPEYQRQFAPLLLLWKGIARYVAAHPETPILFGAVSISGRYTHASRELIVRFFESRQSDDELSQLAQPRRPFRPGRLQSWDCRSICHAMQDLDEISDPIADMETDGKGIPILIKHYSRLGGRLLGFNVDAKFSGVLDGLVVMDLRKTQPSSLECYMGKSGMADFRRHHGLPAIQNAH